MSLLLASPLALSAETVPRGLTPEKALSDFVLRNWTTADGLPTDVLLDVMQTKRGYLWVAGFGGLGRFDGLGFETFNQPAVPELGSSSFYRVVEDDAGVLWIASQNEGVWKYDDGSFSPATKERTTLSVRALLPDRSGRVFVGTAERGAFRLDSGELVPLDHPDLKEVTVRAIFEDRAGSIWFGTEEGSLVRLRDGKFESYRSATGLGGDSVVSLCDAGEGGLWIGSQSGLSRLEGERITKVPELAGVEIFGVAEDDYGSLWIAAEQGLFRRNGLTGRYERLEQHQGRSLRSINTVLFDHEGSVWVSSYISGLMQLRDGLFKNYGVAEGLASERVNSVYQARDGSVLVGGDRGAVQRIEDGRISAVELERPLPDVRVRGFLESRDGALWLSSYAGLLRVRGRELTLFDSGSGLPTDRVRFAYEDRAERLWAGTRGGGLVQLRADGSVASQLDRTTGLRSDFVLALAEDASGRLLIGTQAGFAVVDRGGDINVFDVEHGLPASFVFNVFVDSDDVAWVATTGGLARFRDGRFDAVTVREGLPAEAVYDYTEDDLGYSWMTSNAGLIRVETSHLDELLDGIRDRIEPDLFDESDGMVSRECTGATKVVKAVDGRLWIPTLKGVAVIDPRRLEPSPVAPPVWIDRLSVDGETINVAGAEGLPIVLGPGPKRLRFSFSALSYLAPAKVRVLYWLEGFDEGWMDAGSERAAVYTGLPPGYYRFRVIAANESGVWNENGAALEVRVAAHFYETPYFRGSLAVLLLTAPWALYKVRTRAVRRRATRLEALLAEQRRLERERGRLIEQLESRNEQLEHLTYAITHDLKSPVHTIQGFLGLLDKDRLKGDEARVKSDIGRIRDAADLMSRLLEELHRLWRTESTERSLERVDMEKAARQAISSVERRLAQAGMKVHISSPLPSVTGDPVQLVEVFQNLVENAAKFKGGQERPRVEIGCDLGAAEPVFYVRDNGVGIESRHHDKIFRLFERLDPSQEGTGVGLAVVKRIVERHGGRIWVESQGSGRGSTFLFTVGAQPPEPKGA